MSNSAYPLFTNDFDATFPCKALVGRWTRVGEPTSAKKAFRSSGRVFQLRLPTQTENEPLAGFARTSVAVAPSVFFWRFRAALLAACERTIAGLERAEFVCSSSSSNSDLVRFGMGSGTSRVSTTSSGVTCNLAFTLA